MDAEEPQPLGLAKHNFFVFDSESTKLSGFNRSNHRSPLDRLKKFKTFSFVFIDIQPIFYLRTAIF